MAYDFLAAAQDAMNTLGINTGAGAAVNPDTVNISSTTGKKSAKQTKQEELDKILAATYAQIAEQQAAPTQQAAPAAAAATEAVPQATHTSKDSSVLTPGRALSTTGAPKRLSYTEFYRGTPQEKEATKYLGYGFYNDIGETNMNLGKNWKGENPYRFRNAYNSYLSTLSNPRQYALNQEVDYAKSLLNQDRFSYLNK